MSEMEKTWGVGGKRPLEMSHSSVQVRALVSGDPESEGSLRGPRILF